MVYGILWVLQRQLGQLLASQPDSFMTQCALFFPSVSLIITYHVLNSYLRFTCFMPGPDPLLTKCGLFRFHYWQEDRTAYWLLDQIHFWQCAYSLLILHLFNSSASFVTFIVLLIFSILSINSEESIFSTIFREKLILYFMQMSNPIFSENTICLLSAESAQSMLSVNS